MTRLGAAVPRPSRGLLLPAQPRRAPPSPPAQDTPFEFLHTVVGSEMCAAEDVFRRGHLLPFKPPHSATSPAVSPPSPAQPFSMMCVLDPYVNVSVKSVGLNKLVSEHQIGGRHRRAESLDAYERGAGGAARYWRTKGSASADYHRLRPVAEAPPPLRPKWYVLLFGSVKVPAETDMKSIKSRLQRRSSGSGSGSLRADSPGSAKSAAASGGAAWKLLRSLSCKGDAAGAVDAPLRSYGLA